MFLTVFFILWPIENCGDLCVTVSYWPSYAPGPGNRTLGGSVVFCRPTNVYAGADRICASLLDPSTDGIEYSFGALDCRLLINMVSLMVSILKRNRFSFNSNSILYCNL